MKNQCPIPFLMLFLQINSVLLTDRSISKLQSYAVFAELSYKKCKISEEFLDGRGRVKCLWYVSEA